MELFFRKYGQGKPVIILHGLFGMSDNWVSIAKKLGEDYEVFVPDMRNHGQSPHSDEFNYEVMKNDILEFIERHNIIHPILIGHSMGGKVVMKLALENNSLPAGIIIVDIRPTSYDIHYEHVDLINAMQAVDLTPPLTPPQMGRGWGWGDIDKQLSIYPISPRLRQFLLKNIYRKEDNNFGWKFNLKAIKLNLDKMLEGIDNRNKSVYPGPALFIKGGHSDYIRPEDFDSIKTIFPTALIKTIPNASHWVHADAPDMFLEIVRSFISSLVHWLIG